MILGSRLPPCGSRFLYLVWGHRGADGEFVRFARSKLMFSRPLFSTGHWRIRVSS